MTLTCVDCGQPFERPGRRGPAAVRCADCKAIRRRAARRVAPDSRALRVLSLGGGQQSSALLLLSAAGELPKLDLAVFADTGWERQATYDHLDRLAERAAAAGIPLERVSVGRLRDDALGRGDFLPMPVFSDRGMGRQQCTGLYKVRPIRRVIRQRLGVRAGTTVELWLGISTDEVIRMKPSTVDYITNVFPLVDRGWTRADCVRYLASQGFTKVPRSSCIGCPYKSAGQWRELRDGSPDEWSDAVAFDEQLRTEGRSPKWLHFSRRPLPLVASGGDHAQGDLFGNECEGYCAV